MNIYVISNPNDKRNLVKVGKTADWSKREKAYRTSGFVPHVWHIEYDINLTDDDIKRVLIDDLHYEIERSHGDEWYIVPDGETEKEFADKVKSVIISLKHNEPINSSRTQDFKPRDEQQKCIDETIAAFNSGGNKFLWNCKMRFGKTFTTYQLMKQAKFQNILVLTWKVAVEKSWKDDLLSHRDFTGINFLNKDILKNEDTFKKFDITKQNVMFLSIPLLLANTIKDAKAAEDSESEDDTEITNANINMFAEKIKPIANINWDLLVIDEAHYGTRAKNTKQILEKLKYKRKLELSGTPFKILDDAEYHNDEIYNWTYQQEQKAKYGWTGPKEQNPYKDLPDMHIYTFDGARDLINDFVDTEFNINVLFKTRKDKNDNKTAEFINIESVKRIIDFMCGEQFDLSESKDIKEYDVVLPYFQDMVEKNKKSIWFLPDVASVCAMEKLLNNHKFFKNYKIINASGAGEGSSAKSLDKFHELEHQTDKMICLSCGMLNTGVTIKPLDSVVMLQDKHSAQDFFQSIFRCQSPCPPDKTDCYVFDFNPQRYFNNMLDFSKANSQGKDPRQVLEENLIETHLYIDGNMITTTYDDIMQYVSFDLNPERLKKAFLRSNNIRVELLEHSTNEILNIIDSIPFYKKENKTTVKEPKTLGNKKKTNKKPPIDPKRKQESKYDIRKAKLDILISSLTIFIYITNAQESNVYEIITTKEPDLFNKICFIGVEQFKKLYNYKDTNGRCFFKQDILDKAISRFKNEEYVSRDWEEIMRDEFGLPKVIPTKKIIPNQFSFDEIGLTAGAELSFSLDPNKKCYVAPDLRNVTYQANLYSLSELARILSKESGGKDWSYRGPKYFEFRGVKLSQIIEDINSYDIKQ